MSVGGHLHERVGEDCQYHLRERVGEDLSVPPRERVGGVKIVSTTCVSGWVE